MGNQGSLGCCVSRNDGLNIHQDGNNPYKIHNQNLNKSFESCNSKASMKSYKDIFDNETNLDTNYKSKSQVDGDEGQQKQAINEFGDDMTDYLWDGPEDPDEEISELNKYKNDFEDTIFGVKYSKNGFVEFMEKFFAYESPDNQTDPTNSKLWEQKLNSNLIKMCLKRGGSPLNDSQPFTRNETIFSKSAKMHKVIQAIFAKKCFMQYDQMVDSYDEINHFGKNSYGFKLTKYKQSMGCSSRDYVDKCIQFFHNGKFYRFSCGVPNSENKGPNGEEPIVPLSPGTVRGYTNINVAMIFRDPKDHQIHLITLTQLDLKFNIPSFLLWSFLPSSTRKWAEEVHKFYKENHDKL